MALASSSSKELREGSKATGWIMDGITDSTVKVELKSDIPIGHKVALKDFKVGDTVIKYGVDIGRWWRRSGRASTLHVHNIKTKRW